jgi:hypothetical protein
MSAFISFMITWTDVFYATGDFCQWIFKGIFKLGQGPNIILWIFIIGLIAHRAYVISKQNKEADRNGTLR